MLVESSVRVIGFPVAPERAQAVDAMQDLPVGYGPV
jgi:hypothetical protein